jgi:ATP-dependent DNA ligase
MKIKEFMYFYPEKPKLMHVQQDLFGLLSGDPNWIAEKKYNGSRLQLHLIDGKFQFWNRHEKKFGYIPTPELEYELRKYANPLRDYTLFDGELRHNKTIGVRDKIVIYDVFIYNGQLLVGMPFHKRRKILEEIFTINTEPLGLIEQFHIGFRSLFDAVIEDPEIEGLVLKNLTGKLSLGRNGPVDSRWMFKVRKPSGRYKF